MSSNDILKTLSCSLILFCSQDFKNNVIIITCSPLFCMPASVFWTKTILRNWIPSTYTYRFIKLCLWLVQLDTLINHSFSPIHFRKVKSTSETSDSEIPIWTIKWALFSERLTAMFKDLGWLMYSQGHRKSLVFTTYLIKGRVTARIVLINHDGWTIINDFKFFRNLSKKATAS